MGTQLTTRESRLLSQHEQTIEDGLFSFLSVGRALLAIREDRLYKSSHDEFGDYCQARWNMGRNYANKMIDAVEAADDVSEVETKVGTMVPTNERVAREIAKIQSIPQRADVWEKSVETAPINKDTGLPRVTASHVAKTRKAMYPPEESNGELQTDPVESIRALIKRVDDVRKAIDDIQPVHKTESLLWLTALDKLDEGRKALFQLTQ